MIRRLALFSRSLALPLALSGCVVDSISDSGIVPAAAFSPVTQPDRTFDSPQQVMAHFLGGIGRTGPSQSEASDYSGSSGDQLLLFSADGLQDDSVEAQQWRVVVERAEGGLRVTSAGVRQRCARSGSNEWTNALCP